VVCSEIIPVLKQTLYYIHHAKSYRYYDDNGTLQTYLRCLATKLLKLCVFLSAVLTLRCHILDIFSVKIVLL